MRAQVGIHLTSYDSVTLRAAVHRLEAVRHKVESRPPSSVDEGELPAGIGGDDPAVARPLHEALRSAFVVTDKGGSLGRAV